MVLHRRDDEAGRRSGRKLKFREIQEISGKEAFLDESVVGVPRSSYRWLAVVGGFARFGCY